MVVPRDQALWPQAMRRVERVGGGHFELSFGAERLTALGASRA
jgi:hypothetical protein